MWDALFMLGQILSFLALLYGAWLSFIHRDLFQDDVASARLIRPDGGPALVARRSKHAASIVAPDNRPGICALQHERWLDRLIRSLKMA